MTSQAPAAQSAPPSPPPPNYPPVTLLTNSSQWRIASPDIKLGLRARLPGASAYDRAAAGLRAAREAGVSASKLLAAAMSASWLVNSGVPSPVFAKWLATAMHLKWDELFDLLEHGGTGARAPWSARTKEQRIAIDQRIATLVTAGAPMGAITKVLGALSLEPVPLMPDAALAHVLRAVPIPNELDAQTAGFKYFGPMMDRIAGSVPDEETESQLVALGNRAQPGLLRARDVVDRLVWFDSAGYRHFKNPNGGWYWVRSASDEGVVFVPGAAKEDHRAGSVVEVPGEDEFSERAAKALTDALGEPAES